MKKARVIGLRPSKLKRDMLRDYINEQKSRLVAYAKEKVVEIGDKIKTYSGGHHMDDTGNLLDSLCWGVSYEGRLLEGGFYRGKQASEDSYLHAWATMDAREAVNGHELAERYLRKYGNNGTKGWEVFFAILAPYWGYWEEGFRMTSEGRGTKSYNNGIRSFYKFAVMTETYDQVRADLKPMRTSFNVSVAKYASK